MRKKKASGKQVKTGSKVKAQRKKVVKQFFEALGNPRDALRFFSPDAKQHNPFVKGSIDALLDSMATAQQTMAPQFEDSDFSIKHILVDGNVVAAHTELLQSKSNPNGGGLRQVHIFRFGPGNKIVEYWDITQQITKDLPSPENAF